LSIADCGRGIVPRLSRGWNRRRAVRPLLISLLLVAPGAAAQAQMPASLDARAAQAIIAGCVAEATTKMQSHAIAVVDTGGHLVAALRMDGSGSGIMDFALAKAQAAAAWGFSTAQMVDAAKGTPGFANAPHVVTVAGGLAVFSGDGRTRIGAAGASGEDPADDAACIEAGIRAAGLRSTHS
jgi:glc operon protein GlcG